MSLNMIVDTIFVGQNLGQGLAKSYLDQDTTNVNIANNDKIRNQQIDTNEKIANQKAKAASSLLVNEGLHGIGSNAAMGLYNVRQSNQVDRSNKQQVGAMNSMFKDFNWQKLKDMYSLQYQNTDKAPTTKKSGKK